MAWGTVHGQQGLFRTKIASLHMCVKIWVASSHISQDVLKTPHKWSLLKSHFSRVYNSQHPSKIPFAIQSVRMKIYPIASGKAELLKMSFSRCWDFQDQSMTKSPNWKEGSTIKKTHNKHTCHLLSAPYHIPFFAALVCRQGMFDHKSLIPLGQYVVKEERSVKRHTK